MTSKRGSGHTPMPNTNTANKDKKIISLAFTSLSDATFSFATLPKMTRLYIHKVYAAPNINVKPANNAYQKLA